MVRWYDGLAPVTAQVHCRDRAQWHRVTWRRGRVVAEDHDLGAEAALAGLGGGRCPCLEVLEACRAGFGVDDLFALWTEGAEPIGATHALERWHRRTGRTPPGTAGRAARLADERRTALVASLPLAFRRRLALGVFRSIAREADAALAASASHPGFAPVLGSVLGRAASASLPPAAAGLPVDQRWALTGPGGPAGVEGRLGANGGWLRLGVSAGWVAEVWAWDLALVDGHLVLEVVDRPRRDRADVRLVRWSVDGRPALVDATVGRRAGGWRIITR